jgi:hypothetical protein
VGIGSQQAQKTYNLKEQTIGYFRNLKAIGAKDNQEKQLPSTNHQDRPLTHKCLNAIYTKHQKPYARDHEPLENKQVGPTAKCFA